jgi:benzoate-CoA ligase family protein
MTAGTHVVDPVGMDTPGAGAIGFRVPEIYNASSVLFDNLTNGNAERLAVVGPAGTLTYAQLCAEAAKFGNALQAAGCRRGERVVCLLDDTPIYPAVVFGSMRAGCVPVLLNTSSPADLVAFYVEDSGATIAVIDEAFADRIDVSRLQSAGLSQVIVVGGNPSDRSELVRTYESFVARAIPELVAAATRHDDMAFWMYSSGSTGRPKGVVHLHHDILYTVESYARHILALSKDDVCFSVPKIFFAYGFGNSCSFPFAVGAAAVLMPGRPDAERIFDVIRAYQPTVFFGLPTLFTALIKAPSQSDADLSSVRLCISAAEVLASEVFQQWRARFGHDIVEGLGSTEVLHIYLSNSADQKRSGSAGRPVPGYEVKLVDMDGVTEVETHGILMVRGTSSAPCYWNRPDKTAETMRGDWIWTGDRFDRDKDGFYFFRGRADDLIKVSGQWVYPLEVELCLADHPSVKECAVLGLELPDRRMTLQAFVSLIEGVSPDEMTTTTLQEFVKAKLAPYKYPRVVEYLSELPKTGTGKVDRQALKQRTTEKLR